MKNKQNLKRGVSVAMILDISEVIVESAQKKKKKAKCWKKEK